jgi:prepilin-type N-terminal cleavage/methylation domain-containing protein
MKTLPSRSSASSSHPSLRSNRGFSLIEIMVAVGILGAITYAVVTFMQQSSKQAASVASKTDFNSLVNELQGVFNNSASCMKALGEVAPGSGAITLPATLTADPLASVPVPAVLKIGKDAGATEYKTGTKYGKGLTITKLEFKTIDTVSAGQHKLVLQLETSRRLSDKPGSETAAGGDLLRPHIFNLLVALDATRKVVKCSGQYSNYWVEGKNPSADSTFPIAYMGGYVGINTDAPTATFDVEGTAQATAFMYRSDARLKENVRGLSGSLDRVLQLRGVIYDWKNRRGQPEATDQLGLIAQDVEKVFPEVVSTNPHSGMKSVAYGNLIAPLIEALKEQQAQLEKQQREIEELRRALKK